MTRLINATSILIVLFTFGSAQDFDLLASQQFDKAKVRSALVSELAGFTINAAPVDYASLGMQTSFRSIAVEFTGHESLAEKATIRRLFHNGSIIFTFADRRSLYDCLGLGQENESNPGVPDLLFVIRLLDNGVVSDQHIFDLASISRAVTQLEPVISRGANSELLKSQIDDLITSHQSKKRPEQLNAHIESSIAQAVRSWTHVSPSELNIPTDAARTAIPGNAWVFIYNSRWSGVYTDFRVYLDHNCYKLADNSGTYDYYLQAVTMTTEIANPKPNDDAIQWLVDSRQLELDGNYHDQAGTRSTTLLEHGPTTSVPTVASGFSVGGSVSASVNSGLGASLNASYSETWSNSCVTTIDLSNNSGVSAEWQEEFAGLDLFPWCCATISCTPAKVTYFSRMSAIFRVGSGTSCPAAPCKVAVGAEANFYHMTCLLCVSWSDDNIQVYWDQSTAYIQWGRNLGPKITGHSPESSPQTANVGGYLDFSCAAADSDGCAVTYTWYKDNQVIATGSTWRYVPDCSEPNTRTIKVVVTDPLGASDQYSWTININKSTATPGTATVSGPTAACQSSSQNYSASASNATSYNWTVPSGWTINSGQGTTNISVTVGASSGQVCATPSNACGTGSQGCLSVTVSSSPGTATVSGPSAACQSSSQNYSASASNATSYNWTVPSGWTINSGQGTANISVTVGASSGQVCATPSNACGTGSQGCLSVTVSSSPGTATVSGPTAACQSSSQNYSASASNATSYNWTVPSGWTINSGQGTTNISVTVGASSGQVCATPSNACGTGSQGCLSVTVSSSPGTATVSGPSETCQSSSQNYSASASNATSYNWTVPSGWTINSGQGTANISVTVGASSGQVCATPSNACGTGSQGCLSVTISSVPNTVSIVGQSRVETDSTYELVVVDSVNAISWNWISSCGGTFNPPNANPTLWTAPHVFNDTCKLSVTVTYRCGTAVGVLSVVTSARSDNHVLVSEYSLFQNFPNPFNPSTTINFELPVSSTLTITMYNSSGEAIATLANGSRTAGRHSVTWDAAGFPSGIYYCRLVTPHHAETKKVVLLK